MPKIPLSSLSIDQHPKFKSLDFSDDNILLLVNNGYQQSEIAKHFKRSRQCVNQRLMKLGISMNSVTLSRVLAEKKQLVKQALDTAQDDLALLHQQSRDKVSLLLKTEDKLIPVVAAMDRSFQQHQILTGGATEIIDIRQLNMSLNELAEKERELLAEMGEVVDV